MPALGDTFPPISAGQHTHRFRDFFVRHSSVAAHAILPLTGDWRRPYFGVTVPYFFVVVLPPFIAGLSSVDAVSGSPFPFLSRHLVDVKALVVTHSPSRPLTFHSLMR